MPVLARAINRIEGRDAQRQELLLRPCNFSEIRGVMYRMETFALSCRAMNSVTLGDMIYLPLNFCDSKIIHIVWWYVELRRYNGCY